MADETKPAAGATEGAAAAAAPAAGETKPAAGETTPAGGETKPAEGAQAASSAAAAPTEGKEPEGKAGAESASKAPEKYDLKVPQGADAYLDADDVRDIEGLCRNAGFSNEEAQAVLDEHLARVQAQSERYRAQAEADPAYGGEHLAETQRRAKLAIDKLRPQGHPRRESFLRFLGRGGAGNHIEALSFLADLGAQLDEARVGGPPSAGSGGQKKSHAEVLFGDVAAAK